MNPLIRNVPFHKGEATLSFASRLAAANHRPLHGFLADMQLQRALLARGDEAEVCRLARLGMTEADALLSSALVRTEEDFDFSGERLQKAFVSLSKPLVCPACIADDIEHGDGQVHLRPWARAAWSVLLVRTCVRHATPLVPVDGVPAGHLLQDIVSVVRHWRKAPEDLRQSAEPLAPSGLETYMQQRLEGTAVPDGFLSTLPFYVAVRLTEMIGGMILFGKNFNSSRLSSRDWLDAGREGFAVTSGGADAVRDFLSQSFGNYLNSRRNVGGRVLFGSLHTWLLQSIKNPDYDAVRKIVREHVVETLPIGPGDELLGSVTRRRWHSLHSAALEYGVHPKRLRKLLHEAGHIASGDMALSDGRVLLEAEKIAPVLETISASFTGEDARRYVQATRVQWDILTRQGFVKPTVPATDASKAAYSRASLDDFLTSVVYSAGAKDRCLRHPSVAARIARCGLADIVRMLIERRLKKVGLARLPKGFAALLVDPDEVKSLLPKKDKPFMAQNEASKRMGLSAATVAALIKGGHLPSTVASVPGAHGPVNAIRPQDADAFTARYITLARAAEVMRVRCYRVARKIIEAEGVMPAFDPEVVGCRIYERKAVPLSGSF